MLLRRWSGRYRPAFRHLSKQAKPDANPKTTVGPAGATPTAKATTAPEPPPTSSSTGDGGGGHRRSRLRTLVALTSAPVLIAGSALVAYHVNHDFRQFVDASLGADQIEDLKQRFHGLIGSGGENGDDFERERRPDVPVEDLEESPLPPSTSAGRPLPSDLIRSDQFRAYLHVLVQEREDALRDEFNAHLDRHIAERLENQLDARTKELQARYDADLVAKKQELDAQFEADRERRLTRMAAIEAQVGRVDHIIQTVEEQLSQSEKAHALAAAAIGLEAALECAGPIQPRLALLRRFANDATVGAVLESLPQGADAEATSETIPSASQIRDRFKTVAKACRQAALVPAESGLVGHLIGRLFAMLLINRDMYVAGDDDLAKLHRSQYYLAQAELGDAVQEIASLDPDGLPSALASDWLAAAKKRLALEQAASFLKLYACELSQARVDFVADTAAG